MISPSTSSEIRRLAAEGKSDVEIGKRLGLKTTTVQTHRHRRGIPSAWVPPKTTKHGTAGMYRRCRPACDECRKFHADRMREWTREQAQMDVERSTPRGYVPWSEGEDSALRLLYADERGFSVRQMAEALGRSRSAVAQRITHLGLAQ